MMRFFKLVVMCAISVVAYGEGGRIPRVLILGDSVYQQPAGEVAKALKGKVEVVFPPIMPGEVRNTTTILANLDVWLGDGKWDLIHVNAGLGDLVYRAPGMKAFRVMPISSGGVRATDSVSYEQNLRGIIKQLHATNAKLLWATTTPIRHSASNLFEMGSEVEYNAIAIRVMGDENVVVNDMYTYVKGLIDMDRPASHGADPFYFDRKPLHPPIVRSIRNELKLD
ncbi:MAG: hypothetical protein P8L85_21470 [Rubripirellula sp.]|nr:hypothetical protein [Rubripirellula sp.]